MKLLFCLAFCALATIESACQHHPESEKTVSKTPKLERQVGGPCECCDAWKEGLPENLTNETQISPQGEVGEALEISGTIFQKDGKTPASNTILYVYHTDAEGFYSDGPNFSDCSKQHGHLRGWMKTGKNGEYKFRTIRPASYPNTSFEQHIHPVIKEPGIAEYWIDEFVFDDDPKLNEKYRSNMQERGGNGIVAVQKNAAGVWVGKRDIILGKNVPGY